MEIVILSKSEKPIYEQIYEQILAQILNGVLESDFCLPSIRELSKELEISVITAKKAYELLENDGLIYTRAGKGCFISNHSNKVLKNKKQDLAINQVKKDIQFYKNLGISKQELLGLIEKEF